MASSIISEGSLEMTTARFTVDLEDWYHALYSPDEWGIRHYSSQLRNLMEELLWFLDRFHIQATFYVLGDVAGQYPELIKELVAKHHQLGSHGFWHRHGEYEGDESDQQTRKLLPSCVSYRSPYWDTTPRPGFCGGVFLRILPYSILKAELLRSKVLWLHPHDLRKMVYIEEPLYRKVALGDIWEKLERLAWEVDFA